MKKNLSTGSGEITYIIAIIIDEAPKKVSKLIEITDALERSVR